MDIVGDGGGGLGSLGLGEGRKGVSGHVLVVDKGGVGMAVFWCRVVMA